MEYILKQFDENLMRFEAEEHSNNADYKITWINESKRHLLPLDMEQSEKGLDYWIKHRTIPKNRAFVHDLLSSCGLSINRPMHIISVCKGLSLNDCYWVTTEESQDTFASVNLYDNRLSKILAAIVFTGYGSSIRTSLISSPEFTTNGMLPKCWRRIDGKIHLYKGGTVGASNAGYEPYSEYYAAQIAECMEMNAVKYNLSKWKNVLCSTCELFTSKEYAYIPIGRIVQRGGIEAVVEYSRQLGEEYLSALYDMFIFDAVICNTDRHFGNFGLLIDNKTNKPVSPAPLFDHGNSLFNFAGKRAMENNNTMDEYVSILKPCVYDEFVDKAKEHMTAEHREKLRHLLSFRFKKHPRYNLEEKRLKLIEHQIHKRAAILLS